LCGTWAAVIEVDIVSRGRKTIDVRSQSLSYDIVEPLMQSCAKVNWIANIEANS
jgi:hypothetical protein